MDDRTQIPQSGSNNMIHDMKVAEEAESTCPFSAVFTATETSLISRALQVDNRLCESELLCYAVNKKVERKECQVTRRDICDAWNAIPLSFKTCIRNADSDPLDNPRVLYFGASPRSLTCCLMGTTNHPQLRQIVLTFIAQHAPQFRFSTFALREDARVGAHRDTKNAPTGTLFQVLSDVQGGGLWIASREGTAVLQHQGTKYFGCEVEAKQQPVIFDARSRLHATREWQGGRRLVLVAWSVAQVCSLHPDVKHELHEYGFPLPSPCDV